MAVFKCKMCGGSLEIAEGTTVCTCDYCGTEQTLPKLDSDKKANLYDRANHFRRNNDFDKAMSIYEQILNEDSTDAEAYWSLVICKYGIEYVEDPASHKRVPTVNRAQFTSIFDDENYKSAIANADAYQKTVYEQEAHAINEIQKGILAISSKEEPFDVFICYKETDDNGRRTPDSVLANDLYHQLTQEGFKVFFSRITLEDKLGQEYEPYIFAALNSAKVMVVLGTKPEYYNAVWVKNEWSRYLALIKNGEKKMLIPAYKDMDPYDLPDEFSHLQAQDMSKLGFMQDLIRGIKKIIGADQPKSPEKDNTSMQQNSNSSNMNVLLKRGNMALEDGDFAKADEFFEEVLNQDAECAEAYLGKFLIEYQESGIETFLDVFLDETGSPTEDKFEACPEDKERSNAAAEKYVLKGYLNENDIKRLYVFDRHYTSIVDFRKKQKEELMSELDGEKSLTRARKYATGDTKAVLDKMMDDITATLDARISDAQKEEDAAKEAVIEAYKKHLDEADEKANKLYEEANQKREHDYRINVSLMNSAASIEDFERVRYLFKVMNGYKDTMTIADKCQMEADKLKEAERLDEERRETARSRQAKKKKKIIAIVAAIAVACITMVTVVRKIVIPNNAYSAAIALMESGDYISAYEALDALNGYKDSDDLKTSIELEYEMAKIEVADVGDVITFGEYNGNTEWIVLERVNNKVLIISKYAITEREYNTGFEDVTWEICTLREWLNTNYLPSAFNSGEKALISDTSVVNADNSEYDTDGGNDTTDKIFLLSIDEVNKYFSSDSERQVTLSDGTRVWWWLRSPGNFNDYAADVCSDGSVDEYGRDFDHESGAVRPAMWIDVSSLDSDD